MDFGNKASLDIMGFSLCLDEQVYTPHLSNTAISKTSVLNNSNNNSNSKRSNNNTNRYSINSNSFYFTNEDDVNDQEIDISNNNYKNNDQDDEEDLFQTGQSAPLDNYNNQLSNVRKRSNNASINNKINKVDNLKDSSLNNLYLNGISSSSSSSTSSNRSSNLKAKISNNNTNSPNSNNLEIIPSNNANNNSNVTELDTVKHKLSSFWNNVKYGWTRYLKMPNKIDSDSNEPIYILGKKFYSSNEDVQDQSSSRKKNSSDKIGSSSFYDFFDASISPTNKMSILTDSFVNTAASSPSLITSFNAKVSDDITDTKNISKITGSTITVACSLENSEHLQNNNQTAVDDYLALNYSFFSSSPPQSLSHIQQLVRQQQQHQQERSQVNFKLINESIKSQLEQEIYSRLWFTYRKDFEPLNGNFKYTSDCGWGCMLRSAQMLLAQGILVNNFGKNWSLYKSLKINRDCNVYKEIISLFNDRPSKECPFGLHNLLEIADRKLGTQTATIKNENSNEDSTNSRVGTWFGPTSVCLLVKDALNDALLKSTKSSSSIKLLENIRIYVAQDCTIFRKDVIDLCTPPPKTSLSKNDNNTTDKNNNTFEQSFIPCILLVSVRLGGEELNEIYVESLKMFLEMDQCIGIIGGKPKHSLYFFGYQGDKVIYLDPHFCQPTVHVYSTINSKHLLTQSSLSSSLSSSLKYSNDDASVLSSSTSSSSSTSFQDFEYFDNTSYHCNSPSTTSFTKLDPSLAIGFYCKTLEDLNGLCDLIKKTSKSDTLYPIFGVCDDSFEQTQLNYQTFSIEDKMNSPSLVNIDNNYEKLQKKRQVLSNNSKLNDINDEDSDIINKPNRNFLRKFSNGSSTQKSNSINILNNNNHNHDTLSKNGNMQSLSANSNFKSSISSYLTNKIHSRLNGINSKGSNGVSTPRDIKSSNQRFKNNKTKQNDQDDFVLV